VRRSGSAAAVFLAGVALAAGAGGGTAGPPSGAQLASLARPPATSALAAQRIYFVMPDRYANGDPANDTGGRRGGRGITGYDPTDGGYFHGGDYEGLTGGCTDPVRGLQRLKDLGFTSIWVTPPVVQQVVDGGSAGYHGYWGLDFLNVDPHLGTNADFGAFVACAHSLGLKVIMDVVVNHTADVVRLTGGSSYGDAPYRDCKGRVFDPARYVGAARFPCLRARDMPRVPFVLAGDARAKSPAWLNDPLNYHDRGDIDFGSCSQACFEQGDFYGLDDLFTEKPAVMKSLAAIYADWIRRYRLDGFRVDTARHVNASFFRLWVPRIMAAARAAGVPGFQIFGEVPLDDAVDLAPYVRDRGLPNVLDFPLQDAAAGFVSAGSSAKAVASRLADDDYFRLADGVDPAPPTFLGNHDMGRAARQIRTRMQPDDGALLERTLLGYDLLYLLRGAPVVYYGDEVGMIGSGGDKAAREDMFPTQVADWQTEPRLGSAPIGTGSSFAVRDNPIEMRLKQLAALRDANSALATGPTIVRSASGRLLVFSRIDTDGRREYIAALNAGSEPVRVTVRTATPSSAWQPLVGAFAGTSGADGSLMLTVPPLSTLLLRADGRIPAAAPSAPVLKVGPDDLTELLRLTANVPGTAPVSVAFAVRPATGGTWKRVAVDDTPPYRAFLEPGKYRRRARLQAVAVVRALDGRAAVSKVLPFTVRR
jgi:glycosidase